MSRVRPDIHPGAGTSCRRSRQPQVVMTPRNAPADARRPLAAPTTWRDHRFEANLKLSGQNVLDRVAVLIVNEPRRKTCLGTPFPRIREEAARRLQRRDRNGRITLGAGGGRGTWQDGVNPAQRLTSSTIRRGMLCGLCADCPRRRPFHRRTALRQGTRHNRPGRLPRHSPPRRNRGMRRRRDNPNLG